MKYLLLFLITIWGIAYSCTSSYPQADNGLLTTISVDSIKNVGIIPYGKELKIEFCLKNTGKNVLMIHNIESTCGCTQVNYSQKPVKPGNSIIIEMYYDAKSFGKFSKQVKVFCNTPQAIHILNFKGEINGKEQNIK